MTASGLKALGLLILIWTSALAAASQERATASAITPAWTKEMPADVRDIHLSPSGNCLAVTLNDRFLVLDRRGAEVWHWDFRPGNRYLTATRVAIAPNCEWAVFAGDSGYRYAWIVRRRGSPSFIKFQATPLSVAISHGGDRIAIGDGANTLWLFTPEGGLLWNKRLDAVPVIDKIAFAEADHAVMTTAWSAAVLSMDGTLRFSRDLGAGGMRASHILNAFVAWNIAWHSSSGPTLSFLSKDGNVMWYRDLGGQSPYAAIAPSGEAVAIQMLDDQSVSQSTARDWTTAPYSLKLLSSSGDVLHTFRERGIPITFSADGRHLLVEKPERIESIDFNDAVSWSIASSRDELSQLQAAPNMDVIVLRRDRRIEWYQPPRE